MNKTCKDCLHCSIEGADKVYCSGMPWHYPFGGSDTVTLDKEACEHFLERDAPTLFDDITVSPEVLAEKFVIKEYNHFGGSSYISILLKGEDFYSYERAVAATVAKLKEPRK